MELPAPGSSRASYRGAFFDLYGTLLIYGDMQAAWADWLTSFHGGLAAEGLHVERETLARGLDGFIDRPEPPPDVRGRTLFERRVVRACADLGLHPTDAHVATLSDGAVAAWQEHVPVDPVAATVLGQLGGSLRLALVSNFDHQHHVHGVLARTGLVEHFESVVISAEVGAKKPDPRIFDGALAATGLLPEEVVYVGDADVDVAAARAAGIQPIRIRREAVGPPAHAYDFRHDDGESADPAADAEPAVSDDDVLEIRCLTELVALLGSG